MDELYRNNPLIVIAGPTAVGKSGVSVLVAEKLGGEIISADSMQVYRHMDIGTAKLSKEEMKGIKHHLIDILEPHESFDIASFQKKAFDACRDIYDRGKLPVMAGGTGFYIQSVVRNIDFSKDNGESEIRHRYEDIAAKEGAHVLYELLKQVDPASCEVIHENNVKRVIRALEFYDQTGQRISEHNDGERRKEDFFNTLYIVLTSDREKLYQRIDRRVDDMCEAGLVEEVAGLKAMGLSADYISMQGLGYKEILEYLDGDISLEEAVYRIKLGTRHFAKRQLTWFKREKKAVWINTEDFDDDFERIASYIVLQYNTRFTAG